MPTNSKTPKQTRNRVKQLCNFISAVEIHANYVVICCSCCSVQNYCFYLALVYCQPLDHIFCSQCCSASDTETARLFQCCVHHTVSKTTFNNCSHSESRKSKENKTNIKKNMKKEIKRRRSKWIYTFDLKRKLYQPIYSSVDCAETHWFFLKMVWSSSSWIYTSLTNQLHTFILFIPIFGHKWKWDSK